MIESQQCMFAYVTFEVNVGHFSLLNAFIIINIILSVSIYSLIRSDFSLPLQPNYHQINEFISNSFSSFENIIHY